MEQLHFVKADPSGNTTIIVLDPVPYEHHSRLAQALMDKNVLSAEQVAFLDQTPPRWCDMAIRMMGGEFCGNAVRAAAAWQVFDRERWQPTLPPGAETTFEISCSGIGHNVRCTVCRKARTVFDVRAEMPLPLSYAPVAAEFGRVWQVAFPGITHYCVLADTMPGAEEKQSRVAHWLRAHPVPNGEAAGVLFWDGTWLDPFVYVKDTDTLVNESSCGSGTAALAAALACERQGAVHVEARQAGGVIYGEALCENGTIRSVGIGGLVRFTAEGMAYV